MSYLVQNFVRIHYSLRATVRLRTVFLIRNCLLLLNLTYAKFKTFRSMNAPSLLIFVWQRISPYLFRQFVWRRLIAPHATRYIPTGLNFLQSLYYKWLLFTNLFFSSPFFCFPCLQLNYYQYFEATSLIATPYKISFLRYTLYQGLQSLNSIWLIWPKLYNLQSRFTVVPKEWWTLYFLGFYYLKVYNI